MPSGIILSSIRPLSRGDGVEFILKHESGEESRLSLPDDLYLEWHGRVGDRISNEECAYLEGEAACYAAFTRGVELLGYGDVTRVGMIRKLRSKGFSAPAATRAADRLVDLGLINEVRYARTAVRYYLETKNYGYSRIVSEMYAKGFSHETVENALSGVTEDAFICACRAQIDRKFGGSLPDSPDRYHRAIASLVRYGFTRSQIAAAVKM